MNDRNTAFQLRVLDLCGPVQAGSLVNIMNELRRLRRRPNASHIMRRIASAP